MISSRVVATLSLAFALLSGCVSSAPLRYYTLGAPTPADLHSRNKPSCAIAVGTITIPEMVDRPQIVLQTEPNRVVVLEQHRWAEPLKSEISHAIVANLTRQLTDAWVIDARQQASRNIDYRISIDVQRFDSQLNEAAVIEALWVVRRASTGDELKGRTLARETWKGNGYDALAAAHGRALQTMSGEIADAIRSLAAKDKGSSCFSANAP